MENKHYVCLWQSFGGIGAYAADTAEQCEALFNLVEDVIGDWQTPELNVSAKSARLHEILREGKESGHMSKMRWCAKHLVDFVDAGRENKLFEVFTFVETRTDHTKY